MPHETVEVVYVRNLSNGNVHKRYRGTSGKLYSFEGCNLDDASQTEEIDEEAMKATDPLLLCRNDFPLTATTPDSDAGEVEDEGEPSA